MAESILKLKVDSQEYESKIRRASAGLQALNKSLNDAGKSFLNADKDQVAFIKELGKMDTVSRDARGKINELSKAFIDLSNQYNKMDEAAKNSAGGKALAESLEQIRQRTIDAKNEFKALNDQLQDIKMPEIKNGGGGLFGEGGFTGMLSVAGGNLLAQGITKLGAEIGDTIQQSIELAKQGEGIRIAFERLNRPDLLDKLKEATHGTVSELELMKQAVKFNDFKLNLDEMGTLLAFAQQKAKDTGQSVDYMVDSIVTGLGRQSLMILDNLGLSAAQIKDRMKETGDMTSAVASIIKDQMSEAGEYVETAADRAARAAADATNQMEELGRKAQPVAEQWAQTWATIKMGALDLLNTAITPLVNALTQAGRLRAAQQERGSAGRISQQISWLQNPGNEGRQSVYERISDSYVDEINHARSEYNKLRKDAVWNPFAAWNADKAFAKLEAIKQEYADFKKQAEPIMNSQNAVVIKTDEAERNVGSLTQKLKELEAQRRKAIKEGNSELSKDLLKQINQLKSDIRGLDPNALKTTGRTSHTATKPEQAQAKFDQAERDYQQALAQAAMELRSGTITEADAKKKELQAKESLWKSIGDAREIYDSPKLEEAQRNVENEIIYFGGVVKAAADAQKSQEKAARELEAAQKKLADAENKLAEARKTGSVTAVYKAQQEVDRLKGSGTRDAGTMFGNLTQSIEAEIKFDQMKVDEATLKTLLTTAIQNGLNEVTVDYAGLQAKIAQGIDIPESTWKELQDEINEKLAEFNIAPINIDLKTGNLKALNKDANETVKGFQQAAQAIGSVSSALNGLEDPGAKIMGIVGQAIAQIALGFSQATAASSTGGIFAWIAAIAGGMATMISTIGAIHSATGYANGGIVDGRGGGLVTGTTYSSDQIPIMANAGEVVLNASQQSMLANNLQNNGGGKMEIVGVLTGENVVLMADRWGRRTGKGELLFGKNL